MAAPVEMLMKQVFKALGLEPEKVMEQVGEIRGLFMAGYRHAEQANRRLARIEAHLGLGDIEPIPTLEIIHVQSDPLGSTGRDGDADASAR